MGRVVLLGDSIFDNGSYVPGQPAVMEQLQQELPPDWRATLLAVDGDTVVGVAAQLEDLPADATHLIVSVGGNDALGERGVLDRRVRSVEEALEELAAIEWRFRTEYARMLERVRATGRPTAVCTIYDRVPGLEAAAAVGLALFNEAILRTAFAAGVPVLDLRFVCDAAEDYSALSPIEPSHLGGRKIAQSIARIVRSHDFSSGRSVVYIGAE